MMDVGKGYCQSSSSPGPMFQVAPLQPSYLTPFVGFEVLKAPKLFFLDRFSVADRTLQSPTYTA